MEVAFRGIAASMNKPDVPGVPVRRIMVEMMPGVWLRLRKVAEPAASLLEVQIDSLPISIPITA